MKGLSISLFLAIFILGSSIDAQAQRDRRSDDDTEYASSFSDNFWWGAGFAFQIATGQLLLSLEPMLGYKIDKNENFSIGPKLAFSYTSIRYNNLADKVNSLNYGGGLFGRAKVYQGYFAHVEYEKINETIAYTNGSTSREWSNNYFIGGGIRQGGDRAAMEVLILLNLAPEDETFSQSPLEYRLGFSVNF